VEKNGLAWDGHYSWELRRAGRCKVFRRDRSSAADRLSDPRQSCRVGEPDFERSIWSPDRNRFVQDYRERAEPLFESLREDCRRLRPHGGKRCRRGHESPAWWQIYSSANALFHAIPWGDRNARGISARLSGVTWLYPNAGTKCHPVLQRGRSGNTGSRRRNDAAYTRLLRLRSATIAPAAIRSPI